MARYLTSSVVDSKLFGSDILRFRSFLPPPFSRYIYIYEYTCTTQPPTIGESVIGAWKFARPFIPLSCFVSKERLCLLKNYIEMIQEF